MVKIPYPIKYVTKDDLKRTMTYLGNYPNAGPNPNVTGMRNLYWGWDAPLLKHGRYVYKVPLSIYRRFR